MLLWTVKGKIENEVIFLGLWRIFFLRRKVFLEELKIGKERIKVKNIVSSMCHQCHKKDKEGVILCTACPKKWEGKKRYCINCVQLWYPNTSYEAIVEACLTCCGNCNCRSCLHMDPLARCLKNWELKINQDTTVEDRTAKRKINNYINFNSDDPLSIMNLI